jgi:hypothetical protein
VKKAIQAVQVILFLMLVAPTSAFATTIVYDFGTTLFGTTIQSPDFRHHLREIDSLAVNSTIVYDSDTLTAVVTLAGQGYVRDLANGGTTIVDSTDFFTELVITNVIPITDPEGLLGFAGVGASSFGTVTVADFGDITGDGIGDTISYDIEARFMNFASYAGSANYKSEIADLGSANFFLWDSTILGGIAANAWYRATGNFFVNGQLSNLIASGGGDIHLRNGSTEVPEPATALLLSFGLLGGAVRRKRS